MKKGQSLVEATLVLLVFFALLLGVIDCGQVMYSHQVLQERVRSAVRWGSIHPFDASGDQVANMILYAQPAPAAQPEFLGLTRANIQVRASDDLLTVSIVNYQSHFFSPWFPSVISPRPVIVSAPLPLLKKSLQ
jgi:hypothetical protein